MFRGSISIFGTYGLWSESIGYSPRARVFSFNKAFAFFQKSSAGAVVLTR